MSSLTDELTTLYSLHNASLNLEHGIRQYPELPDWQAFSPTRFIYAFFTFNNIYKFDWGNSFEKHEVLPWDQIFDATWNRNRGLYESEQFQGVVSFYYKVLDVETPKLFSQALEAILKTFNISNPEDMLMGIQGEKKEKKGEFQKNYRIIRQPNTALCDHEAALYDALCFIYKVRCNIFHGSKTKIEMEGKEQQTRLLIYTAILIATNSLLFEAVKVKQIGWSIPKITLNKKSSKGRFERT